MEDWDLAKIQSAHLAIIVNVISEALDFDHVALCNRFSSEIPVALAAAKNNNDEVQAPTDHEAVEAFEKLSAVLGCETQALEILSNLVFTETDENDSDIEELDEDVDFCEEISLGSGNGCVSKTPIEVLTNIQHSGSSKLKMSSSSNHHFVSFYSYKNKY